jgi:hypothetical protein
MAKAAPMPVREKLKGMAVFDSEMEDLVVDNNAKMERHMIASNSASNQVQVVGVQIKCQYKIKKQIRKAWMKHWNIRIGGRQIFDRNSEIFSTLGWKSAQLPRNRKKLQPCAKTIAKRGCVELGRLSKNMNNHGYAT